MISAHHIEDITFENNKMHLRIDGKLYSIPLETASGKLAAATEVQRNLFKISPSGYGIHWPLLDEDLATEALIKQAES